MTNFTHIGRPFTDNKEASWSRLFDELSWQAVPCELPMMQAEGIKGMIRELNLPPAVQVAWSTAAPVPDGFALLAAEFKTDKQHFQVFALDAGTELTPLAIRDFEF